MKGISLTIFDWVTYLFPGAIFIWAAWELNQLIGNQFPRLAIRDLPLAAQIILLLVICYSVGHLLQSIANFTIDLLPSGDYPTRNYFPKKFQKHFNEAFRETLLSAISNWFGIPEDKTKKPASVNDIIKNAYWPCYTFLVQKQRDSLVQVFLSIAAFYRSMSVNGFLIAIGYFIAGLVMKSWFPILVAIAAILMALLFLARVVIFKEYLTRIVYSSFLSAIRETVKNRA